MTRKRYVNALQQGMTLIEVSVVLLVLVALAGLAVPYVGGIGSSASCQTTDATLHAVKDAIMGGAAGAGYYAGTLGKFPQDLNGLATTTNPEYGLYYLFSSQNLQEYIKHQIFNAKTGVGWRGPYLTTGVHLNETALNALDDSFGKVFSSSTPTVAAYVHFDIKQHDGNDADSDKTPTEAELVTHVLDAWHRPIILQVPYNTVTGKYVPDYARLVSAGPGNGTNPGDAAIDTKIQTQDASDRGDDRVLYLKMPDPLPGGNTPCNES